MDCPDTVPGVRPPWRAVVRGLRSVVVVLTAWVGGAVAQTEAPEYEIKAAMLGKIALFVDWPAEAFREPLSPFVVAILGDDPFGPWLEHVLEGLTVDGHPVEIRRVRRIEGGESGHMLFISRSEGRRLEQTLKELRGSRVLTISDLDRFCESGGMIGFVSVGRHVRLVVNAAAVEEAGLTISARLQRVALTVHTNHPGERR